MENTICTNDIPVIFEDEDILVINKPVGILSEDSQKGEKGILTLLQMLLYDLVILILLHVFYHFFCNFFLFCMASAEELLFIEMSILWRVIILFI